MNTSEYIFFCKGVVSVGLEEDLPVGKDDSLWVKLSQSRVLEKENTV